MEEIYSPTATDLIIKDLDHIFIDEGLSNVITSEVIVAYDGSIIIPDIGKLKVAGKLSKILRPKSKFIPEQCWKMEKFSNSGYRF